jgi:hypothetical protein
MEMVKVLNKSVKTIQDYWHALNILKGINNTDGAREEVSENYLNGVGANFSQKLCMTTLFQPVEEQC